MEELKHLITRIDDNGEFRMAVYDPNDVEQRRQLEQDACDCPICAALLRGEDPIDAMPMNRAQRRRLRKVNAKRGGR